MAPDMINELDPYSDGFSLMKWLESMDMMQCFDNFVEAGFGDSLETAGALNHDILKEMGIKKIAHRMIILDQIKKNQQQIAKMNREGKTTSNGGAFETDGAMDIDLDGHFVQQVMTNISNAQEHSPSSKSNSMYGNTTAWGQKAYQQ